MGKFPVNLRLRGWQPFAEVPLPDEVARAIRIRGEGTPRCYVNNLYQVLVSEVGASNPAAPKLLHLSIKRRDQQPVRQWRDLQRIKNELVGPECEGIELFPKESRLVDSANQFHLFVFADPAFSLGIGFRERLVAEGPYADGAVQEPFFKDERPADCLDARTLEARYQQARASSGRRSAGEDN